MTQEVAVRNLEPRDSHDLWRIRNTESVRRESHNTDPIPLEAHNAWFARYLANLNNEGFVVTCDGKVVGYCRIDSGLVSIAIDPDYHGRGLSKLLLKESVEKVAARWPRITAEVKKGNPASTRLFEGAGFILSRSEASYDVFEYGGRSA